MKKAVLFLFISIYLLKTNCGQFPIESNKYCIKKQTKCVGSYDLSFKYKTTCEKLKCQGKFINFFLFLIEQRPISYSFKIR